MNLGRVNGARGSAPRKPDHWDAAVRSNIGTTPFAAVTTVAWTGKASLPLAPKLYKCWHTLFLCPFLPSTPELNELATHVCGSVTSWVTFPFPELVGKKEWRI